MEAAFMGCVVPRRSRWALWPLRNFLHVALYCNFSVPQMFYSLDTHGLIDRLLDSPPWSLRLRCRRDLRWHCRRLIV
jgi:hypothetical protein